MVLTVSDTKKIIPVLNKFDNYFEPRRSEVLPYAYQEKEKIVLFLSTLS